MITRQQVYIGDFESEARSTRGMYGKTELFSSGNQILDKYLGGGFGRKDQYEILVLYGPTGIGKSTVTLNLLATAISNGTKVGLLVLEDDFADVSNRLAYVLGEKEYTKMNAANNVLCIPRDALDGSWNLDDVLDYLEYWYTKCGVDLVVFDPIQMAFEGAESIKGENEYIAQRVFMRKLNVMMKRVKKTIIIVSHVAKGNTAKGMDKIVGSGSIAQAATKVIEISKGDLIDSIDFTLQKSRFTKLPGFKYTLKLIKGRLESAS